jgi:glycosyltransferase involved in cell wall biosynthesis
MKNNEKLLDVSVILPVRNEQDNVARLTDELVAELERLNKSYEIIAINLPADDNSYEVMKELGNKYEHFYPMDAVYLQTKGYQKGYQYMLGFSLSKGKILVQMDSDYQDDPADLSKFFDKLDEGFDMVTGWKQDRKDPFFYMLTSRIQNFITRITTGVKVHDKNCGFKAYNRAAMESLNLYGMNYRDIPMQLSAKGFKIAEVPINNRKRVSGKSNFTFFNRLLGGTLDFTAATITSLMIDKPFRFWGGTGMILGLINFVMLVAFAIWVFVTGGDLKLNWYTILYILLIILLAIMSMGCFAIGVIAEYTLSLKKFKTEDYHIIDDPKGRMSL